mmetsp:Transcript_35031/g.63122  ORF Transcript_35031/g.63122 Transcript_35031/m.63122 type:complete len:837 (+) Transcript_35031:65-2575(+)|eukprot:CAMPEP_0115090704 /NCGR_PEP_ID=MMETSP0227-20121206/25604_1 /TAXON_ID=89957 /ORGANISM="Polarella glacialis, Strain CCMP 1383" /LENGTH=836 /DNA_ID=CAMNT_0002481933 /DNA_START=63 /DNA_END=2573 /DNA_ORIENTATION=+
MSSDEEGGRKKRGLGSTYGSKRRVREEDSDDDLGGAGRGGLGLGFGGGGSRGKKRRGGNDENIMGVFADGGSDSEGGRRKKGGGKGGSKGATVAKAVAFVKSSTMINPSAIPAKKKKEPKEGEDKGEGEGSEEETDSRFVFDGAPNTANVSAAVHGPQLPAKNKLSFNQMATSYGRGFAMMQKMGFTGGGLGKHNDGIANPIEVIKRAGRTGLQDEGELVGQDLYGTESSFEKKRSVEELLGMGQKKDAGPKVSEAWKKDDKDGKDGKSKRPKVVYKTAAELAAEPQGMRIIDMRGPEVRVASSFSELAASMSGDGVKSLKEFRHNSRLLVARYEDKVRGAADRKKHFENVLLGAAEELNRLEAADGITESEVTTCRELVLEVENLRLKQDEGTVGLKELAASFKRLLSTRPKEFRALHCMDVAFALALPTAKREFSTWRPLQRPDDGLLLLKPWKELADSHEAPAIGKMAKERAKTALVTGLLEAALLPRLRQAVGNWSPRDVEPCLLLVERCKELLPIEAAESIGAEVVLPRLRAEVETWDPRVDKVSAHLWLHPWLPVLGSRLDVLWAPVRFKISACLDRWDPSDHSAHGLLKPWKQVFAPSNWDPLIEKVLVRLERGLMEMAIRPDGQDLQPMKDVFVWLDLAPLIGIARVLEAAFFPQWHTALRSWLRSPGCDLTEVLSWYQGWKALLPSQLREQPSVQKQMAHGLEVMKHVMANGPSSEAQDEPAAPSPERRAAADEREPAAAKVPQAEEVTLSLSEYISEVAAEEGLVFLPKKMQHLGKQVYQLGSATIRLDRNLVHVAPKGGSDGEWKAVSMDEVLALAREKPAKKKS